MFIRYDPPSRNPPVRLPTSASPTVFQDPLLPARNSPVNKPQHKICMPHTWEGGGGGRGVSGGTRHRLGHRVEHGLPHVAAPIDSSTCKVEAISSWTYTDRHRVKINFIWKKKKKTHYFIFIYYDFFWERSFRPLVLGYNFDVISHFLQFTRCILTCWEKRRINMWILPTFSFWNIHCWGILWIFFFGFFRFCGLNCE